MERTSFIYVFSMKNVGPLWILKHLRQVHCKVHVCYNYINQIWITFIFVVHCSLSSVMQQHAPFMRQCWGLPHRLAHCMSLQELGMLVNAELLSLINVAFVNVCCATLLSSELVGPACVQAWSSNPRGRACRPSGKGSGEEGILSDIVPVYLYLPRF